jgi:DNA-binding beta-propeller fold protein YncE
MARSTCEPLEPRLVFSVMPAPVLHPHLYFAAPAAKKAQTQPRVKADARVQSPSPAAAAAAPVLAAAAGPFTVSTTQVGTTGLRVSWTRLAGVTNYRIAYIPGAYVPGPGGARKTVTVGAGASSVTLGNLRGFTLYSIDVKAVTSGQVTGAAHANALTAKPSGLRRYLYAFDLPKSRRGFQTMEPQIEVFDIENGHQWVKNIPLPEGIYNVRGVAASAQTDRVYVSFFDHFQDGYQPGGLLCMDMRTDRVVWLKRFDPAVIGSPDRFALTPDGRKIYMPTGENGASDTWAVLDAANGNVLRQIHHVTSPHNTNMSVDGRFAFLEGQEKAPQRADVRHTVAVVDTATDRVVKRVGPFRDVVRPFTINGKASLVFATVNNMIGFEVGDVATGRVLYTATPPGFAQPARDGLTHSHGIAMTPDEREVWVVDNDHRGLQVWDVSDVPAGPPRYVGFVKTRATGKDLQNRADPAASNDATGVPAWVASSWDGRYMYAESGEVIEVAGHRVVGQLRAKGLDSSGRAVWAPYTHSRFILEVDVSGTNVVNVTDQFGTGRVR